MSNLKVVWNDCYYFSFFLIVPLLLYFVYIFIRIIYLFVVGKIFMKRRLRRYGEWAVITGCTGGIGLEYTRQLAKIGINLVLVDKADETDLANFAKDIEKEFGILTRNVYCDFNDTSLENYEHLFKITESLDIGILVNNAGIITRSPNTYDKMAFQGIKSMVDINMLAPQILAHYFIKNKFLQKKKGLVVFMGSFGGVNPNPYMTAYYASKAHINFLAKCLNMEFSKFGIYIQALCPSFISTSMTSYNSFMSKPGLICPSPNRFVSHALSTFGMSHFTTGYPLFEITAYLMRLLPSFVNDMINIIIFTYLKNTAKVYDICAPNQQTVKMSERKYDRHTTAMEVVEGMDLGGKTILITGANNGIGFETARALAIHNAHVVMACRNLTAAENSKNKILKENRNAKIDIIYFNAAKLKSVESCAKQFIEKQWPLHVLILNAGVYGPPQKLTEDGFEYTFQVNHLAHFYLVQLLSPVLFRCVPARVVVVASQLHNYGTFKAENVTWDYLSPSNPPLISEFPYCTSKFCNVLFSKELHKRWHDKRVTSNSLHPGATRTQIARNSFFSKYIFAYFPYLGMDRFVTADKGAATSVYCAVAPELEGVGGQYFDRVNIANPNAKALNDETAKRLWELSESMIMKWKKENQH